MNDPQRTYHLVEDFFRNQWQKTIASLAVQFGAAHLDEIENAVQFAMTRALEHWSISGVPRNPGGWIYKTAKNHLTDEMRRRRTVQKNTSNVFDIVYAKPDDTEADYDTIGDEVLKMIFVCCHPSIKPRDSIVLTLRVICGLGFHEIASGLYMSAEAVRKSLVRCKQDIVRRKLSLELPDASKRSARLGRVLKSIYLLFNEGYFASGGDRLVRDELCREAERLTEVLRNSEMASDNRVWALSALIAFQSSRLPARMDADGRVLLLLEQDRSRWDWQKISEGFTYIQQSITTDLLSRYHLEAVIAACHASAKSYSTTDWSRILRYYEELYEMTGSPVVQLNRAVAIMELNGPEAALPIFKELEGLKIFKQKALLAGVIAECYKRMGDDVNAGEYFSKAMALTSNHTLNNFFSSKMAY